MENLSGSPDFVPPPPPLSPPPVITAPPASKPRRSWGWMIVSIILAVLLGFAGLIIIGQSVTRSLSFGHGFKNAAVREVGPKLDECILEDNDSKNKIAVITVDGIITSHGANETGNNMVEVIKAQLDRAADDDRVKAVILKVDSPRLQIGADAAVDLAELRAAMTDHRSHHRLKDFRSHPCGTGNKEFRELSHESGIRHSASSEQMRHDRSQIARRDENVGLLLHALADLNSAEADEEIDRRFGLEVAHAVADERRLAVRSCADVAYDQLLSAAAREK